MKRFSLDAVLRLVAVVLGLGGIAITVSVNVDVTVDDKPPVAPSELGWAGPEAVEAARPLTESLPRFQVVGLTEDNSKRNVRLWEFAKKVNGGDHIPTYRQEVGDCVSFGCKNAIEYLQAVQLFLDFAVIQNPGLELDVIRGPPQEGEAEAFGPKQWNPVYAPYIYGTSRVQVGGGRLRGDGSVGAWAAKAVQDYGVLAANEEQVPPYSGSVARKWGSSGPPKNFIEVAKQFPVKTVSKVRNADEACDALCNGYPITIASNAGFGSFQEVDGVWVGKWNTSWMHQMCLIGYDGSKSLKKFYCLNSWGASAHKQPLDGEPPGGFWIRWDDVDKIVKQGDSFAFSAFEGFPAVDIPDPDEIDFTVVGDLIPEIEQPTGGAEMSQVVEMMNRTQWTMVGLIMMILAVMMYYCFRQRSKRKSSRLSAALLFLALTASTVRAQGLDFTVVDAGEPRAIEMNATHVSLFGAPKAVDPMDITTSVNFDPMLHVEERVEFNYKKPQQLINETWDYYDDHKTVGRQAWLTGVQTPELYREWLVEKNGFQKEQVADLDLPTLQWLYSAVHFGDISPIKGESQGSPKQPPRPRYQYQQFCDDSGCRLLLVPTN